jgi:hypothetical protein
LVRRSLRRVARSEVGPGSAHVALASAHFAVGGHRFDVVADAVVELDVSAAVARARAVEVGGEVERARALARFEAVGDGVDGPLVERVRVVGS